MEKQFEDYSRKKEAIYSDHLSENIKPIMVCVSAPEHKNFNGSHNEIFLTQKGNANYFGNPEALREAGFKNPEKDSYVISPVSNLDKFSNSFINCLGLVVAGQDKNTGENISIISHQRPDYFTRNTQLEDRKDGFVSDLKSRLGEIESLSREKTIDAVLFGGNYFEDDKLLQKEYEAGIGLISQIIEKELGFIPVVATGSKNILGDESVEYDNKNRRLYIFRKIVGDGTTKNYSPTDFSLQKEEWRGLP
ncbi:MAG: hypothetical protein PHF35_04620 [Candidatus Moranbacteria bacterium]|nr:hypothetical protein [Candidatus Moranbacteria bacterium]